MSYITDWDVSSRPGILAGHRVVMTMGHGEYWSKEHRDALEAARDAGQNLAFLGANLGYWQVRYTDGGRTLVGYKSNADPISDPALKTDQFRNVGRPECQLIGVQYNNTSWPLGTSDDMFVDDASLGDPWFAGSGFGAGAAVTDMLGYEWDQITPGCATPPLTRLFRWQASGWPTADGVRYTAPSGAKVFAAGTLQFAWGLDGWRWSGDSGAADPRLVAFTNTMLADMGGIGDSGPPPPAVTVTPATATVLVGSAKQFTATVQNASGGVSWSVDGGAGNGTVDASGVYTAPATVPSGGHATVRATNAASGATGTASVTVTAPTKPQVTTQPADRSVVVAGSATFTAVASGIPVPTVQWQVSTDNGASFTNVSGATTTTFILTGATLGQSGNRYRAVFTNSAGTATTSAATLTVSATAVAPRVITQPVSHAVTVGATVSLTAAATGAPTPAVQWQLSTNGGGSYTDIPEANATTLTLSGVAPNQNHNRYRAVFSNSAGTAVTDAATLTVGDTATGAGGAVSNAPAGPGAGASAAGARPRKPHRTAAHGIAGRVVAGRRALSRIRTGHVGPRVILAKVQVGGRRGTLRFTAIAGPWVAGRCAIGRVAAREVATCRITMTRPFPLRKVRFTARFRSVTGAVAVRRAWVRR